MGKHFRNFQYISSLAIQKVPCERSYGHFGRFWAFLAMATGMLGAYGVHVFNHVQLVSPTRRFVDWEIHSFLKLADLYLNFDFLVFWV